MKNKKVKEPFYYNRKVLSKRMRQAFVVFIALTLLSITVNFINSKRGVDVDELANRTPSLVEREEDKLVIEKEDSDTSAVEVEDEPNSQIDKEAEKTPVSESDKNSDTDVGKVETEVEKDKPSSEVNETGTPVANNDYITVTMIDVGQGDSILFQLGDYTILIDAGTSSYGNKVNQTIANAGIKHIDLFVATHGHADHIGGMSQVIEKYAKPGVSKLLMHEYPKSVAPTSKTYETLLTTAIENNLIAMPSKQGQTIYQSGNIVVKELTVSGAEKTDQNNSSLVLKISYGNFDVLTTGDIESSMENSLSSLWKGELESEILKVPHHGSGSSSSSQFVSYINPDIALISSGLNNSYGHPHDNILALYQNRGTEVYQTPDYGNIVIKGYADGRYEIKN